MRSFYGRQGGKSKSAELLISLFPPKYDTYVEPFFGAGSVFFRKPYVDKLEVINDLDEDVYKVLKLVQTRNIDNLINRDITKEYFNSIKNSNKPIHLLEKIKSSFRAFGNYYAFPKRHIATDYSIYKDRLKNVIILNDDFCDVIKHFDNKNTFFFLDPPYENDKQSDYKDYVTPEEVYNCIKKIKGKFLLTYNDSPKIRSIFRNYNIKINKVIYENTPYIPKRVVNELIITNYPI
jgi:DNA adenine methylase